MSNFLGRPAKDKITGFSGTITGVCIYLTGCNQLLVTPKKDKSGAIQDARWVDEQRLDIDMKAKAVVLDNSKTPGCDIPAATR